MRNRGRGVGANPRAKRALSRIKARRRLQSRTAAAEVATADVGVPDSRAAWRRLGRDFWRPSRTQILIACLLFVFGLGGVLQVRSHAADQAYSGLRRADLVTLLDGLTSESRRLETEVSSLSATKRQLETGAGSTAAARAEAEKRLDALRILAGTVPVEGPGIRLVITDPAGKLSADLLIEAVQELRDAGAEVIEIDDRVRVVASTWFATQAGALVADGTVLGRPIVIEAIGDPHALEEGARFRGGLVSSVTSDRVGGTVSITRPPTVVIDSVVPAPHPVHAQPA